jgi:hypothetical protein
MTSEDPDQQPAPAVDQDAVLSGNARAYQAGRDLQVTETVLPEGVLRPVEQVAAPSGLMNVPVVGLFVGRSDELAEVEGARLGDAHGVSPPSAGSVDMWCCDEEMRPAGRGAA